MDLTHTLVSTAACYGALDVFHRGARFAVNRWRNHVPSDYELGIYDTPLHAELNGLAAVERAKDAVHHAEPITLEEAALLVDAGWWTQQMAGTYLAATDEVRYSIAMGS